ncbi:MAG: hypothetical protein DKT66_10615 [Candidatus Melainabacteria bacterium]|nr:MAG: hypothetical protein DKT66_10615 [Candidatus Melainabacteria bacterium]
MQSSTCISAAEFTDKVNRAVMRGVKKIARISKIPSLVLFWLLQKSELFAGDRRTTYFVVA